MRTTPSPIAFALACSFIASLTAAPQAGESPADHLPPHIVQLTAFGERPDWSADGKKILFLSKTFGDALEIDLATRQIHNRTAHFGHHGIVRALYLVNGDILLTLPESYDPAKAGEARRRCFLYVLDKSGTKPPVALGTLCNEGPAVSRTRLHIAWTHWIEAKPAGNVAANSQMFEADIVYTDGTPKLANQRLIIDGRDLPFRCNMETQNFRPPEEKELTFCAYTENGTRCDVAAIDLVTKKVTKYTDTPQFYDEPEGIFPDGRSTLVECDRQQPGGIGHIDLWRLALDGSGAYTRLTFFSDFPNYKASNPVVSDDGKFFAFQMGKSGEAAGVGHGIFVYDLTAAGRAQP